MAEGPLRDGGAFSPCPSFLKCVKCLKRAENPVITLCLHTICGECFDSVVKVSEKSVFKCPLCGCDGAGKSQPPDNSSAALFQEVVAESSDTKVYNCSACEKEELKEPATTVCLDCPSSVKFLCDKCLKFHSYYTSHSLLPATPLLPRAQFHPFLDWLCFREPSAITI